MPDRNQRYMIGFGCTTAVLLLFAWLIRPLPAFSEAIALTAMMPALFYFLTVSDRGKAKKIGGIASCVIWITGIGLAFLIPPKSPWIYVPDTLLLLGFFPLLYLWRFSWPWIVFGLLNVGIGILLQVIEYSEDTLFPADLLKPKHHLAEYHPATVWWFSGIIATMFGVGRLIKNLVEIIRRKKPAPEAKP